MNGKRSRLEIHLRHTGGMTIACPAGTLDVSTYPHLRDTLLKCAVELPEAVLVEVSRLDMPSAHALSVFPMVAMRCAQWPAVPLMLVAGSESRRSMLAASTINRFVPVYASVFAAMNAVQRPPARTRALLELPRVADSSRRARRFVRETCGLWQIDVLIPQATAIVNELVENTLRHTSSSASLRLELRQGVFTVAVSDDDPRPAVMHELAGGGVSPGGMLIITATARAWGCIPTMSGGKTVWATLKVPGHGLW
jgi:hypothetical protein